MYYFLERYRLVIYATSFTISGLWLLLNKGNMPFWDASMEGIFGSSLVFGCYFAIAKFWAAKKNKNNIDDSDS